MSLLVMCASTRFPDLTANLHDADSATVINFIGLLSIGLGPPLLLFLQGLSQGYDGGITDGGSVTVVGWVVVVVMVAGGGNTDIKYLAAPAPGEVDSSRP